ncbi:MAG: nucleoid-associated protein [Bacteroidia bacterium]|nr:nucleoid-associated protein [Bacteroidia bacterium]
MIGTSEARLYQVAVHIVGNKTRMEENIFSGGPLEVEDDALQQMLITYFLSNFSSPEYYAFTFSNGDVSLNPVFRFVTEMFESPETFHENSINIARHLYDVSQHPNIKAGDLYVAHISGVAFDNRIVEGIGIFKSENKESYLKLKHTRKQFDLSAEVGTNVHKLDKGCLVLRTDEEAGYKICIVDNANASEAQFWREDF